MRASAASDRDLRPSRFIAEKALYKKATTGAAFRQQKGSPMNSRVLWCAAILSIGAACSAEAATGAPAAASGPDVLQAFLTLWSRDDGVTKASVDRLYAPEVIYYGKQMSRAAVLADKQRFARHWPVRDYGQIPGTLTTSCTADYVRCTLKVTMTWRRATRDHQVTAGRARLKLEFVTVEGNRKIIREAARPL